MDELVYLHQILLMQNLMIKLIKSDQFNGKQDLGKSYIYAYIIKLLMLGYVIIVGKEDTYTRTFTVNSISLLKTRMSNSIVT